MLLRIACSRCRLASLWTDEPAAFLATICREPRRCQASLRDERFGGSSSIDRRSDDESDLRRVDPAA